MIEARRTQHVVCLPLPSTIITDLSRFEVLQCLMSKIF